MDHWCFKKRAALEHEHFFFPQCYHRSSNKDLNIGLIHALLTYREHGSYFQFACFKAEKGSFQLIFGVHDDQIHQCLLTLMQVGSIDSSDYRLLLTSASPWWKKTFLQCLYLPHHWILQPCGDPFHPTSSVYQSKGTKIRIERELPVIIVQIMVAHVWQGKKNLDLAPGC